MDDLPEARPRLVKKVAVGFGLNALPPALIRSLMVLRAKIERAGWQVEVSLRPLNDLPADVDVLFVQEPLLEAARQALPGGEVMGLVSSSAHQPSFDALLDQLTAGQKLYAERAAPAEAQAEQPRRIIIHYQGNTRVV